MRKLTIMIMTLAMLFVGTAAHAGSLTIDGYVRNPEGRGIAGATLTFLMLGENIVVNTNSVGYYRLDDHNFCGSKFVWLTAPGYITVRRGVTDNTCCECVVDCDPDDPSTVCATSLRANFTMNGPDSDGDSYYDAEDNCPTVPNGPDGGTCTAGTYKGYVCDRHGDCGGCLAFCSLNQEDSDGDGIGDACEGGSMLASVASTQSIAVKNNVLNLFALWLPMYCAAQGGCDYECLGQAIEDFLDGRDNFMGRPITPEPKPLTYECPEFMNFQELVNLLLDNLFDFFHGDNFPPEE